MTTLVEFIKARLDREDVDADLISSGGYQPQEWHLATPTEQSLEIDDETYAELRAVDRVIGDPPGDRDEDSGVVAYVRTGRNEHLHMARYDPARIRREVAAKRDLLGLAQHMAGWTAEHDSGVTRHEIAMMQAAARHLLEQLAAPYLDHPDYQSSWSEGTVTPSE